MIVIDPLDGKLEAMDDSETADRHLRYHVGSDYVGYRVDVFLDKRKKDIEANYKAKGIDFSNTQEETTTVMAQNDNSAPNQQDLQAKGDESETRTSANNYPTSIETKYGEVKMEEIRR